MGEWVDGPVGDERMEGVSGWVGSLSSKSAQVGGLGAPPQWNAARRPPSNQAASFHTPATLIVPPQGTLSLKSQYLLQSESFWDPEAPGPPSNIFRPK